MATKLDVAMAALGGLYDAVQDHGYFYLQFAREVIGEMSDGGDVAQVIVRCYHKQSRDREDWRLAAWWLACQLDVIDEVRDELTEEGNYGNRVNREDELLRILVPCVGVPIDRLTPKEMDALYQAIELLKKAEVARHESS